MRAENRTYEWLAGGPISTLTKRPGATGSMFACLLTLWLLLSSIAAQPALGSCPNEQFRSGELSPPGHPSSFLPDCRAYEQASPVEKRGEDARGTAQTVRASSDGNAISFLTTNGTGDREGGQDLPTHLASRGGAVWSTQGLLPNQELAGSGAQVLGWTPDFSEVFDSAWTGEESELLGEFRSTGLFARSSSNGSLKMIAPRTPRLEPEFVGSSEDGSIVVFESSVKLASVAGALEGKPNVYVWDRDTNVLRLASVLNEGEAPLEGALAGAYNWAAGTSPAALHDGGAGAEAGYYTQDNHVLSADGSRVYFTAGGSGTLYLRKNLSEKQSELNEAGECTEPAKGCTVVVSASQRSTPDPADTQPAAFAAATPDGSKALFTSSEKLTDEATTGPEQASPSIGRADLPSGDGKAPAFLSATAAGIAIDDEHLYWANAGQGTIGRAKLNSSGKATELESEFIKGVDNPRWLAVDDEYVYWTDPGQLEHEDEGSIGRARIDHGEPPKPDFITKLTSPKGIAVNGSNLYWTNVSDEKINARQGAIGRADLDGNGVETDWFDLGVRREPQGIALNSTSLYWTDQVLPGFSTIERVDLDGTNYGLLELSENNIAANPEGIALNATNVYWITRTPNAIGRANLELEGVSVEKEFIPLEGNLKDLKVDGEHVYWTLNGEPTPNPGNDLYRFNADTGGLSDLSVDPKDTNGAEVRGVLGASADGSKVYFAANGDLDGNGSASAGDCHSIEAKVKLDSEVGECNLYLSRPDPANPGQAETVFVARVEGGDHGDWRPNSRNAGTHNYEPRTARVSADGNTLLFTSSKRLTPYDNEGISELYRYRVGEGALSCVSCNPAGATPEGKPDLGGTLKLSFLFPPDPAPLLSRNLSASGNQVFFETTDALLPEDTNGEEGCPNTGPFNGRYPSCLDVYEWEAQGAGSCESNEQDGGCLYLLSPPHSTDASFFGDASASGEDVFLFTREGLVRQDNDRLLDVYDTRINGGLVSQNEVPSSCEGEGCKLGSTAPPAFQSPQTPHFEGPPHAKEKPKPKCRKKKGSGKGKSNCTSKKHKRHGASQKARGASR